MAGVGQRILPTEIIPIIDGQTDRHKRRIGDEFAHKLVSGRAGRTSLAGEQLDNRAWIPGCGRRDNCRGGAGNRGYVCEAQLYHSPASKSSAREIIPPTISDLSDSPPLTSR